MWLRTHYLSMKDAPRRVACRSCTSACCLTISVFAILLLLLQQGCDHVPVAVDHDMMHSLHTRIGTKLIPIPSGRQPYHVDIMKREAMVGYVYKTFRNVLRLFNDKQNSRREI